MKYFNNQLWHLLSLIVLLFCCCYLVSLDKINLLAGELWGISTNRWLIVAILSPILHQIYVVVCWRLELYNKSITNKYGFEKGFKLYKIGFAVLILSRIITLIPLAISNQGSLNINPYFSYLMALILLIPAIYLFYSVKKYFGMNRAFGIDHFKPKEFQSETLVKKGIFKYTSNGMYFYGFLILWVPGFLFFSKAALMVALFQHIYIWVHFYCTELPDMNFIYGKKHSIDS